MFVENENYVSVHTKTKADKFPVSHPESHRKSLGCTHSPPPPPPPPLIIKFKARLPMSSWCTQVPIILLGIHAALKEDLITFAAEMVYSTSLCLPGDFFDKTPKIISPSTFADKLWQYMVQLIFSPVINHGKCTFHAPHHPQSATHFSLARCPSYPTSVTIWWAIPSSPQGWQIFQGGSCHTYR